MVDLETLDDKMDDLNVGESEGPTRVDEIKGNTNFEDKSTKSDMEVMYQE